MSLLTNSRDRLSPRVDVILPNYNKVEHIDECLTSLKRQTYEHWRCIVIDGYSDDGSWERIQDAAAGDERFDLHRLDRIGLYPSWNVGLDRVTGSYFAVLTSDDVWGETWLQEAVDTLETHQTATTAAARTYIIDAESKIDDLAMLNRYGEEILGGGDTRQVWDGLDFAVACFFMGSVVTSVHSVVVRSDVLDDLQFPEDAGIFADWAWITELGLLGDIVHCPQARAYWRKYDGQASDGDPGQRAEQGAKLRTLFEELSVRIADRLKEPGHTAFQQAAQKHLSSYFPFLFRCPSLRAVTAAPGTAIPHLMQLAGEYPLVFLKEMLYFLFRQERYINKKRKQLARRSITVSDRSEY
jgi:glycosyltransferase involved in cell wall biosynthesis